MVICPAFRHWDNMIYMEYDGVPLPPTISACKAVSGQDLESRSLTKRLTLHSQNRPPFKIPEKLESAEKHGKSRKMKGDVVVSFHVFASTDSQLSRMALSYDD